MEGVAVSSGGGGTTLSDVYQKAKRLQLKIRDSVERLERLESSSSAASSASPEFAFDIKNDISQLHSLCTSMDNLWRSVAVKSQRDIWKRFSFSLLGIYFVLLLLWLLFVLDLWSFSWFFRIWCWYSSQDCQLACRLESKFWSW